MRTYTIPSLRSITAALPRHSLAKIPTPLDSCPRYSVALEGPNIWIKREDLSDLALGGNKGRMIEFIIGNALDNRADCILKSESYHSNFDRMLAAAGAKVGLEIWLQLYSDPSRGDVCQGNYLLMKMLGSKIEHFHERGNVTPDKALTQLESRLIEQGRRPYKFSPHDRVLSTVSYVECFLEIIEQHHWRKGFPGVIVCAAHGATQSGLILGAKALGLPVRIIGVRPETAGKEKAVRDIIAYGNSAAELLGIETRLEYADVESRGADSGTYHFVNKESVDAISLLARTEGILAGPVYVGKALAEFARLVKERKVSRDEEVVFIHTGDIPNLFSYSNEMLALGNF